MSGRIPQQFIDDLLERIDIVDVIDARVNLRKSGKNYSALCPFHDEKSPSFSVNPEKQFYYCFGCGAGGNAIGFLMEYERLEFPVAVEKLAALAGVEIPREAGQNPANARQAELVRKLEASAKWFQRQLAEHPQAGEAREYLARRGLSPETIQRFGIGFAPQAWDALLKAEGGSETDRKLLLEAGLVIRRDDGSGVYDRFRHRVMFPIHDNRGRTVAFGGRVLGDEKPKYLNSPETAIFHKGQELYGLYQARQSNRELERVLVVEGYMDVVMLAQHGIDNATGTLGTALSSSHLQRLFRHTSSVVFCFDGDEAGRRAAARALELVLPAMQDGRQASFLFLPEGEDPDSLVQRIGAAEFRARIAGAKPLADYLFEHFAEDIDLESMDGRARLSKLALPAIDRIPGTVFRELMRGALATRVGVAPDRLPGFSRPPPAPEDGDPPPPIAPQPARRNVAPAPRRHMAGAPRTAIRLLLQDPRLARQVKDQAALAGGDDPDLALLQQLLAHLDEHPDASLGALLGFWYGTPEGELLTRLAAQDPLPGADVEREFLDAIEHIARQAVRAVDEVRRRELESIPFAQMTDEQKRQYRELLSGIAS